MCGDAERDSDALDSELELELFEAVPGRVAERSCLGGGVGRGVADGVDAKRFVRGDGADVDVCLDLADGGSKVALWARVDETGEPSVSHGSGGGGSARRCIQGAG